MKKEMLINVLQPEECRIAIVEDGILEELYVERTSHESYVGNIYKGRIVNIEPSIQAAFVDFGVGRNGFLHVSDVEPQYYKNKLEGEGAGRKRNGRGRDELPDILDLPDVQMVAELPEGDDDEDDDDLVEVGQIEADEEQADTDLDEDDDDEKTDAEVEPAAPDGMEGNEAGDAETKPTGEEASNPKSGGKKRPRGRRRNMRSAERRTEDDASAEELHVEDRPPVEDVLFPRNEPVRQETPRVERPRVESSRPTEKRQPAPRAERSREQFEETREPIIDVLFSAHKVERRAEPESSRPQARHAASMPSDDEPEPIEDNDALDREDVMDAIEDEADDSDEGAELEVMAVRGEGDGRQRRGRRGRMRRPGGRDRGMLRQKPPIQEIFRRGQEVLVQVIKEGIGTKGPTLSTYISIPGRYLVLMPGLNRIGVSRKIVDEEQRRRLREILGELEPPKGLGFIIRTAGLDKTKRELQRDLAYLTRLWKVVVRRIKKLRGPASIYQESDMITRTIRDVFTNEIETIWVDEPKAFEHAQEFLQIVMPRYAQRIKQYTDSEPLFHKYGIEEEINRIQRRRVPLPNGGSLVIDQTEALVAIDVNSGNFRVDNNAEETAYRVNLIAAKEIARQLRLRDLGGVIVNDFIDMREERHRREVEKAMRDAVKRDRARTKLLRMSQFGIIEMTRQRIRPSLKRSVYEDCPACNATGQVKTTESMSIEAMRLLQLAAHRPEIARIHVTVAEPVAQYLLNKKRREIARFEETGNITVTILAASHALPETLEITCHDPNGNEIKLLPGESGPGDRRGRGD